MKKLITVFLTTAAIFTTLTACVQQPCPYAAQAAAAGVQGSGAVAVHSGAHGK